MNVIIVTGDRYAKRETWLPIVEKALNFYSWECTTWCLVLQGGADGIDKIAANCCSEEHYLDSVPVPAQWKKHGKPAGPIRNTAMLKVLQVLQEHGYRALCLAFHDDIAGSSGTKDMANKAVAAGVETWHYTTYNDPVRITARVV